MMSVSHRIKMSEYKLLEQFLQDNINKYKEEYNLLTGENQPPFIVNI